MKGERDYELGVAKIVLKRDTLAAIARDLRKSVEKLAALHKSYRWARREIQSRTLDSVWLQPNRLN